MRSRGRVLSCNGLCQWLRVSLCGLVLSACAGWPVGGNATTLDHVQFLLQAERADPARRREMWFAALRQPGGDDRELQLAILESLAGHPGFNLAAARFHLGQLSTGGGRDAVEAIAALRLHQLNAARLMDCPAVGKPEMPVELPTADTNCQLALDQATTELRLLQQRLEALIEIETQYQKDGDEALDSDR